MPKLSQNRGEGVAKKVLQKVEKKI